jgi:DNA-directed RNA polymerase subunit RPC12/RpoP
MRREAIVPTVVVVAGWFGAHVWSFVRDDVVGRRTTCPRCRYRIPRTLAKCPRCGWREPTTRANLETAAGMENAAREGHL